MSAPAARAVAADAPVDQSSAPIFISRQPVLDAQCRLTGYRVAYAPADTGIRAVNAAMTADGGTEAPNSAASADGGATRLFGDILSVVGLVELVGEALAHLAVSRTLLLGLGVPPVRPDQVVLRVTHEDAVDPDLRPILDALAGRGYALSLYDLPGPDIDPELMTVFGIVEVDFSAWGRAELSAAVATIARERATALAVGVDTDADYGAAKAIGCSLFAGRFFASPRTTEVRDVPVGALSTLSAVARLQGAGATIEDLEAVIDRDLGLSVKLLRYINSAYFGMRGKITSIRQAVMMLGPRGVARWALMVALTGGTAAPTELSLMALTRGRMCELLAAGRTDVAADEMFLVGLLSLADALLDTPLDRVVGELPLADQLTASLLHRAGPGGEILNAVTDYELGRFASASVQAHSGTVAAAYLDALRWARDTIDSIG